MANAKKCDRCGKLYERYSGIQIIQGGNLYNTVHVANDFVRNSYDMCPECMTKLKEFLTEMEGENEDGNT